MTDVPLWKRLALDVLNSWTDDERVEFLVYLREHFCEHCGRKFKDDRDVCHCNNDE